MNKLDFIFSIDDCKFYLDLHNQKKIPAILKNHS